MSRQSITFSDPNAKWLDHKVSNHEYSSRTEAVNSLVRAARIRDERDQRLIKILERAVASGVSQRSVMEVFESVASDIESA